MKNELLTIGPLTVYGYGFMIASRTALRMVHCGKESTETPSGI